MPELICATCEEPFEDCREERTHSLEGKLRSSSDVMTCPNGHRGKFTYTPGGTLIQRMNVKRVE